MVKITIIGAGYVGLVTGACLADFGNTVICVDTNAEKIAALNRAEIPIYEPGLENIVRRNVSQKRLSFSTDLCRSVRESEVVFIAVGTPSGENGAADISQVESAARQIGGVIEDYTVLVIKSTAPVGSGRRVKAWLEEEIAKRAKAGEGVLFDVVSNPEFLREGAAVQDFTHPDRIVIGTESERARAVMKEVYRTLYLNEAPYIETNLESAEMIKYATNAFLAVKISFINEIANLCEKVGANVQEVAKAVGRDGRIGRKFLHSGPGYGGSCFPKDTKALARLARDAASPMGIVEQSIETNEKQKQKMVDKIRVGMGSLDQKTIAVLGLSFKPNTDDMREAPSLTIIRGLAAAGARIRATDPAALREARRYFSDIETAITYFEDEYRAIDSADALVIVTEWNQYRNLNLERVKKLLSRPLFFDLRNIYKRRDLEERGFTYFGVGQ